MRVLQRVALPVLGFLVVIAVWWLLAVSGVMDRHQLPRPDEVVRAAYDGFGGEGWGTDLRDSVLRVLAGVALGCAVAVPVGFVLAWFQVLRAMFDPLVNFFRALPPIALIPLVIVYVGTGEDARISILTYAAFFASVVVIYESVAAVDDIYVRAGRAMGATELEIFRRIVLPLTVPQLLVAVRVALGVSWATLVAAELIAAQTGLGALVQRNANFFRFENVYAGIILIGLCALVMDGLLRLVMVPLVRWQERVAR